MQLGEGCHCFQFYLLVLILPCAGMCKDPVLKHLLHPSFFWLTVTCPSSDSCVCCGVNDIANSFHQNKDLSGLCNSLLATGSFKGRGGSCFLAGAGKSKRNLSIDP